MNDYKNNWFYKLCKVQCAKDTGLIVFGALLIAFGLWMLINSVNIAFAVVLLVGILLTVKGFRSYLRWLPDVKSYLQNMQQNEFAAFSANVPESMYGTFYFTNSFLCVPSAYALIRYNEIGNITTKKVYHHKYGQKGVCVNFEFMDGRAPIKVNVRDWRIFENEFNDFMALVQQHRSIEMQY